MDKLIKQAKEVFKVQDSLNKMSIYWNQRDLLRLFEGEVDTTQLIEIFSYHHDNPKQYLVNRLNAFISIYNK